MAYTLTVDDVNGIIDVEVAFSTTRLLPKSADIPQSFWLGNVYTRLAEALAFGREVPEGEVSLIEGLDEENLVRCINAHLSSCSPKHEHKIAGVGFMISQMCTITPIGDSHTASQDGQQGA